VLAGLVRSPARRPTRVAVAILLGALIPAAAPAVASGVGRASGGLRRSVVLELAIAPTAALPAAGTRTAAAAGAAALGLRVDGGDSASLTASGPAVLVARLFPATGRGVGAAVATPAVLRGSVELVVDPADRTRVAHSEITVAPVVSAVGGASAVPRRAGSAPPSDPAPAGPGVAISDLTAAYGGSAPGPQAAAKTRPVLTAQTPVIASLQLAGWEPALLARYARDVVYPNDPTYDPVRSGQYAGIPIGRATSWGGAADQLPDGRPDDGSDAEVALDQEMLLAAAPGAKQRAYFATNTAEGYLAALERVAADRAAGMPIVAFTTSWGSCEAVYDPVFLTRIEGTLRRLVDLGVTLFAASGDDGVNDCARAGRSGAAVDYPSSSVYAVGVGGTSHPNGAGVPLPDTAWVNEDAGDPSRSAGSGGGASARFALPSWQASVGGSRRQVPDIALPADAQANGVVIDTNRHDADGTLTLQQPIVGGTSLASPLAAAMLVNYLISTGFPGGVRGLGDIHRGLYLAARSSPGALVDVVAADGPNDQHVIHNPGRGYDQATGLGTPDMTVLGPLLSAAETAPPPGSAPRVRAPALSTARVPLALSAPSGTVGYFLSVGRDRGCTGTVTRALTSVTAPTGRAQLFAHAVSSALVCSTAASVAVEVAIDDRAAARTRGWTSKGDAHALAHTYSAASAAGAALAWTVPGPTIEVLLDPFSRGGTAQLLIDGRVLHTVSSRGSTRWAVPFTLRTSPGVHTVTVQVLGSGEVRVDGVLPLH